MKRPIKITVLCVFVSVLFCIASYAQDSGASDGTENAPLKRVEPIFPDENKYLIIFEGEDAVSTNFNKEPTQNYSCSGSRALQLSRTTNLQAGSTFYADYVFYIEEDGAYEFWYGGTPPGPKGELYPSYSSPFQYYIDDPSRTKSVYREDMTVVENYAPSYYWNLVREENLTQGRHLLRIMVKEKRGFDSRFYFYLDCMFLVKKEGPVRLFGNRLPEIFPKNAEDRRINQPFAPLDDYLIRIRDNPDNVDALMDVSLIYSLLNDYLNSVKHLKRAQMLAPDDVNVRRLLAKNYIWMAEISTGLDLYKEILRKDPSNVSICLEAGKVAGWTGRFTDSIEIFKQGLSVHPDNLDLLVNMGLSYLWAGDAENADKAIKVAKDKAGKDPDKIKTLARVFIVNGYPDKAVDIYKQGIEVALADLQLYLLLEDTFLNAGKKKDAEGVKNTISRRFISSTKLTRYLDFYHEKIGLKDKVLDGYRNQLKSQPDNLELREMLAQTCFWNGLREEAIGEYLNILANHSFRKMKTMDQDSAKLFEATDRLSLLSGYFGRIEKLITDKRSEISGAASRYKTNGTDADKSRKESVQLASLIADGDEIIRQYAEIARIYKDDRETAGGAIEKAKKDEENFEKMKTALSWEWDRNQSMTELDTVSKTGLVLADHVLARTSQLDGDLATAKSRFEKIIAEQPFAEAEFAYWETLLWSGNRDAADKFFASYGRDMGAYMPYVAKIRPLVELSVKQVNGSTGEQSGDLSDRAKTVTEKLAELASDARPNQAAIEDIIRTLRERISKKVVRAYYSSQESSYLLRNELGDFYLRNEEQDKAIVQYKQVLAIDPNNVSAIYRLGTVYQWKKDWYQAMNAFEKVYKSDPGYENTTRLYNDLARQYADEVIVNANSLADPSRLAMKVNTDYWKYLNSVLKIGVGYDLDYIQFYRLWPPAQKYYAYMVHGIGIGMLFDIFSVNLKIGPSAGVNMTLKDYFYTEWEKNGELIVAPLVYEYNGLMLLDTLKYFPFASLDLSLGLGDLFSAWGTVGYRQYPETFAAHIDDVNEVWMNPSLLMNFSFLKVYPYREGSVRLYATADFLEDKNTVFSPGIEVNMPVIGIDNPNIVLSLNAVWSYQNTFGDKAVGEYYKPNEVLQLTGQAGLLVRFGPREKADLPSVILKFGYGYIGAIDWTLKHTDQIKYTGDAMFKISSDKGSFGVGGDVNITMGNWDSGVWRSDMLGFWSMNVKIEYTSKIQNLLAP